MAAAKNLDYEHSADLRHLVKGLKRHY